jgi:hypothetical protein
LIRCAGVTGGNGRVILRCVKVQSETVMDGLRSGVVVQEWGYLSEDWQLAQAR